MPKSFYKWTPGRVNALLSHVESNKGENGLYMTDRDQALSDASRLISEKYPSPPVSARQVKDKLRYLWNQGHKEEYQDQQDLFRIGRAAMHSDCRKSNLEKREQQNLSGIGNPGMTPQKYAKVHSVATPSTYSNHENIIYQGENSGPTSPLVFNPEAHSGAQGTFAQVLMESSNEKVPKTLTAASSIVLTHSTLQSVHSFQSFDLDSDTRFLNPMQQMPETPQESSNACHSRLPMGRTVFDGRFEKIVGFLQKDPNQFLPSQKYLENQRRQTMHWIREAALCFLETAGINDGKGLELHECHSSPSFFNICKHVYSVDARDELLTKFAWLQIHSPLFMTDFIRALTTAAIIEWVFKGNHNPLPGELSQTSKPAMMYENIVAELDPELHQQVLRKRNHEYFQNQADLDIYLPDLTNRYIHALIPFLQCNTGTTSSDSRSHAASGEKMPQLRDALSKAFKKALELHAQVFLLGPEYEYQSPRNGDEFDRNSMFTESDLVNRNQKGGKVHVALFPALVRITQMQDRNEEWGDEAGLQRSYVFKAAVILQ